MKKLQSIIQANPKYKLDAYSFTLAALNHTVAKLDKPRHVSGQELCEGIREFAIEEYGSLARMVLEDWGIHRTRDFGELVFIMVEAGLMSKTEKDSVSDFDDVYDFKDAFERRYEFDLEDLDLNCGKDKQDPAGYG